jgi:O-antigen/teichoic acid export membrane protein/glycosyltransferase involved in cell wall biosynthesis
MIRRPGGSNGNPASVSLTNSPIAAPDDPGSAAPASQRPAFGASPPAAALADVAVVVPARNAEGILDECLASIVASRPAALVVVDGMSTDATVEIALRRGATVISDEGAGLPAARLLGAGAVQQDRVALIDADVILTDGALEALADEHRAGNYVALQAGLESTGGPGYWGRALAMHHRTGLSRGWFGLVATVFNRDKLIEYGFDDLFSSGEDIDIRWRLRRNGERIGVFEDVVVEHRFARDDFAFARDQWRMDGHGLGQMARVHGLRGILLLLLPLAAAVRGIGLSLLRLQPEWVIYYLAYAVGNYASMARALLPERVLRAGRLVENALGLLVSKGAAMSCGFLFWLLAAHATIPREVGLAAGVIAAMMLCTQLAILGIGSAVITVTAEQRRPTGAVLDAAVVLVAMLSLVVGVGALGVLAQLPRFSDLQRPVVAACFVALVVLGTLNILFDHIAISFGRGRNVALRGAVAGGVPLVPLLVPGLLTGASASALVALWLPGLLLSCVGGWRVVRRELPEHAHTWRSFDAGLLVELLRHGAPNWALTLSDRVPGPLLAVLVTQLLSPTDNAHWYIVWMAAWVVYAVPNSVGTALFAEVAREPDSTRALVRRALKLSLGLGLAGAGIVALAGPALLRQLGPSYADEGAHPLLILLVGVVPLSVLQVRYAICRASNRLGPAVVTGVCTAAGGLALAATVGARRGLTGIAVCWVATLFLAALASLVLVRPSRTAQETVDESDPAGAAMLAEARLPDDIRVSTATRASSLMVVVAVALWVTAAAHIDLRQMNDLGLASVLSARMWIAFGLLCAAMTVALLDRRPPHWILAVNVVVLCACLFGLSSWLYAVPRGAIAFRHAGITGAMIDAGSIDRSIDAYFDWPGFFTLAATVIKAAGFSDPLVLARWAPLVVNLLCIPPLLLLVGSLTQDRRRLWLAVWLACALNWISQDYFAPQSYAFLLYLCVLALLVAVFRPTKGKAVLRPGGVVTWFDRFNAAHRGREYDLLATPQPHQSRPAAVLLVLLLCAALVPSHQLTPFALLTVATALVLLRRCSLVSLPFLLLILIVLWDGYVALPYISGHAQAIFGSVGDVQSAASANIANRVVGSADHLAVIRVRLALTFLVWGLAAVASLIQWRRRRVDRTALALAWSPLLLVLAQPYGGEMLLRVFWFTLPGTALLLASVVLPAPRWVRPRVGVRAAATFSRRRWAAQTVRWSGLGLLLSGLLAASIVARYGNERMDNYTAAELQGSRAMYALAPPHALIVAGAGSFPWKFTGYIDHKYLEVDRSWVPGDLAATAHLVAQRMRAYPGGAVLVITTSQREEVNMLGTLPARSLEALTRAVDQSREFQTIYRNRDVQIWQACGAQEATC